VLPTFVIGLREGVEASLIVGIVAAFLRQQGARDALRWMWAGVAAAVVLCAAGAVALQLLDDSLPQREQEGLETVVAAAAVGMVTFMIVWMRRHARGLAGELRAHAAGAVATGSAWALVAMAFFAVLREGLETAVFMLAAFQVSGDSASAGFGAVLGIATAVVIGWGIYGGGVRLNLGRFFRVTSVALVLVAAGLVMSAFHTAHEAAWLNGLQDRAVDLSWLVRPGSIGSSLLTGVLGLQPQPTVGEAAGWLVYAVPMLVFVLWPERLRARPTAVTAGLAALALAALAAGCGGGGSKSSGGTTGKQQTLAVSLTDAGCAPTRLSARSGTVTFDVSNGGTSKVSELEVKNEDGIILGERENIVGGISGTFTLDLRPGTYTLSCPNGDKEDDGVLVVTGKAPTASANPAAKQLAQATAAYRSYVVRQSGELVAGTRRFVAALEAGDVARAKDLFGPVRLHYEAIEPVAESFGELDPDIDARVNDVDDPAEWTGFHRIEQILWIKGTTEGTGVYGRKLLADVQTLQRRVRSLSFQPAQLANGAVELLNEVAGSKITGEEDRYSHTDLSDFQGNLTGARVAFDLLRPALVKRGETDLAGTITDRFRAVQKGLDRYRRSTPLGFATYDELTPADRRAFAQQIDALAEPLSTVAARVTG
jgi:iron uptake system component EfeO